MMVFDSMLLWLIAGIAAILILQYVLRAPSTPERPEGGLGKRYPVGPRRVRPEYIETAPTRAVYRKERTPQPIPEPPESSRNPLKKRNRQVINHEPEQQLKEILEPEMEKQEPAPSKRTRRTDTMQHMLNKAMAERR